jgi:hypothetical protein
MNIAKQQLWNPFSPPPLSLLLLFHLYHHHHLLLLLLFLLILFVFCTFQAASFSIRPATPGPGYSVIFNFIPFYYNSGRTTGVIIIILAPDFCYPAELPSAPQTRAGSGSCHERDGG